MRFGWRTEKLETDALIVQSTVEGSGSSVGKTLTVKLSDTHKPSSGIDLLIAPSLADAAIRRTTY